MSALLNILLVEDNEGDVEITRRALRSGEVRCSLSVANDGAEALDFLRKNGDFREVDTPQLILLDLNMPRMDGKKLLEVLKADPQFKSIPVVVVTSSDSSKDIRECYERHASCYVVKPFDGKEYAQRVGDIVTFWTKHAQLL